jgi:hypothetical protein
VLKVLNNFTRLFWLMKKIVLVPVLLLSVLAFGQPGYEIKVSFKPFKNEFVYLAHYSGKQFPVVDSVRLNERSEAVFKGPKPLGGGIYILVTPAKDRFIEMLIDKQQHFSVSADTLDLAGRTFSNSPDNDLFTHYQQFMSARGRAIDSINKAIKNAPTPRDSAAMSEEAKKLSAEITQYRKEFISKNPKGSAGRATPGG